MRVDGAAVKPSLPCAGEAVTVEVPPPPEATTAQPVDFTVVYADDDVIVVDKPAGLVVHPAATDQTLVNGLLHRFKTLSPSARRPARHRTASTRAPRACWWSRGRRWPTAGGPARGAPWPAATTPWPGITACPTPAAGTACTPGIPGRRRYTGQAGHGKPATTHFEVLERVGPAPGWRCGWRRGAPTRSACTPRRPARPSWDPVYGRRRRIEQPPALRQLGFELGLERQALHAATLGFVHPDGRTLFFESPIPSDIQAAHDALSQA
ncbi:MAG: hypothetical protein R3F43_29345 [bacterium]